MSSQANRQYRELSYLVEVTTLRLKMNTRLVMMMKKLTTKRTKLLRISSHSTVLLRRYSASDWRRG